MSWRQPVWGWLLASCLNLIVPIERHSLSSAGLSRIRPGSTLASISSVARARCARSPKNSDLVTCHWPDRWPCRSADLAIRTSSKPRRRSPRSTRTFTRDCSSYLSSWRRTRATRPWSSSSPRRAWPSDWVSTTSRDGKSSDWAFCSSRATAARRSSASSQRAAKR